MTTQQIKPATANTETVRDVTAIKRKLIRTEGFAHDVSMIFKTNEERDLNALLDLLVRAVIPIREKLEVEQIRKRQKQLRSIAEQIRTVIRHAQRLALDSLSYVQFYSPMGSKEYKKQEAERLASRWPFQEMLTCADWAKREAGSFGKLLRRNSQKEQRLEVLFLLLWVYLRIGKPSQTAFTALARLLEDASKAAGVSKNFSSGQLRKDFERHVLRLAETPDGQRDIWTP